VRHAGVEDAVEMQDVESCASTAYDKQIRLRLLKAIIGDSACLVFRSLSGAAMPSPRSQQPEFACGGGEKAPVVLRHQPAIVGTDVQQEVRVVGARLAVPAADGLHRGMAVEVARVPEPFRVQASAVLQGQEDLAALGIGEHRVQNRVADLLSCQVKLKCSEVRMLGR
jgi:hypothetical protein